MRTPRRPRPAASLLRGDPADLLLPELWHALAPPEGARPGLRIERERLAGRSSIYFVSSPTPLGGRSHWVVKQPHTSWTQDDLEAPLTAEEEFAALTRLHAHFEGSAGAHRVPAPVALLPTGAAFAMEYVPGRTIRQLLNYGSALHPATLLHAMTAAGAFLRDLHALEELEPRTIDLRTEAQRVLSAAAEKLHPLGLSLPAEVRRTLQAYPSTMVSSPHVVLHGDFGPGNVLLAHDGSTVGLDPHLRATGPPEEDLVRFVALLSGSVRFAPEVAAPPMRWVRRRLETQFLCSYDAQGPTTPLLELTLLRHLVRRWPRARELVRRTDPRFLPLRLRVLGAQMSLRMKESERRLVAGTTV